MSGFFASSLLTTTNPSTILLRNLVVELLLTLVVTHFVLHPLWKWLRGMRWLVHGPKVLAENYKYGIPYTIQTPEQPYLVVSSKEQIRDISNDPEHRLSLVAVAEEIFQPKHTMNGIEMSGLEMHRRLLRKTTLKLPQSTPKMKDLMQRGFSSALRDFGKQDGSWTELRSFAMTTRIISLANVYMFFGLELSEDSEFVAQALQYAHDVVFSAEAIRVTPRILSPLIARLVTKNHRAAKMVRKRLQQVVEKRIAGEHEDSETPSDYLQGVIESVKPDTPNRAVRVSNHLLALWFASIHQPAITMLYAMHDICARPEYVELLREEIASSQAAIDSGRLEKLKLLDSFLKESSRVHCAETISIRRQVVQAHKLSDGTEVPAGHWICVPQREIMNDSALYPDADRFDGMRFLRVGEAQRQQHAAVDEPGPRFTDVHPHYPFWGLGKETCPGRFYAAHTMKLAIIHVLQNFDVRTRDNGEVRAIWWRSARLPSPSNALFFRKRNAALLQDQ